jgi:hypothetical protein
MQLYFSRFISKNYKAISESEVLRIYNAFKFNASRNYKLIIMQMCIKLIYTNSVLNVHSRALTALVAMSHL